jgi:hypothetical protein
MTEVVTAFAAWGHHLASAYYFFGEIFTGKALPGNTKGGIIVLLTSDLTGLESAVLEITIFVFIFKTD